MDQVRVFVTAGTGGQGAAKHGAKGGNGGDVVAVADATVKTLGHLLGVKRIKASPGENGSRTSSQRKGEGRLCSVCLVQCDLGCRCHCSCPYGYYSLS